MLPNRQLKTAAALALALSAIAPAAATAKPVGADPVQPTSSYTPPIVRVIAPQSGFDWGDAGTGAAGGLAITVLGLGGALVITSERRTRHPTSSASPTT